MVSYLLLKSCFHASASFFHAFMLFHMFLFGHFSILLCFVFHIKVKKIKKIKKLKNQKNTKTVCVLYTLVLVYLEWSMKQSFLNLVSLET